MNKKYNNIKISIPPETGNSKFATEIAKIMPSELYNAVKKIDINYIQNNLSAGIPGGLCTWGYITHEENLGLLKPGMKVLELGSGYGSSPLTWSNKGYNLTGIEFDEDIAKKSTQTLQEFRHLQNASIKIFEGSYYPKEYIIDRDNGLHQKIIDIEKSEMIGLGRGFIDTHFHPICYKDIYKQNNFSMKDFDVIYAYMWNYQCPSVFDVFKKYASDSALLLAVGPEHTKIANSMGLKNIKNSHIFRK